MEAMCIRTSITEVIGLQKQQRGSGWKDQEYNETVSMKDKLYRRSIQIISRATKEAYRSKRREVVKMEIEKETLRKTTSFN
uniref:Uncharacterized protein n=1 Tax=Megaselia scalaris TaxID=36166 RepID=T1GE34_MEGSC